jgi:hypothetical protein
MAKKDEATFDSLVKELDWWGGEVSYNPDGRVITTTYYEPAYTEKTRQRIINNEIVVEKLPTDGNVVNYTYHGSDPGDLSAAVHTARFFMARAVSRVTSGDDKALWTKRLEEAEAAMQVAQQRREVEQVSSWIEAGGGPGGEGVEVLTQRLAGAQDRLQTVRGRLAMATD